MKEYTRSYQESGGLEDFSQYYTAQYDYALIHENLRKSVVFALHNLVSDQSFNEFNLIVCRNVFIYFDRFLQNKVMRLFVHSLSPLGYLALGTKESILFFEDRHLFKTIDKHQKIFRFIK